MGVASQFIEITSVHIYLVTLIMCMLQLVRNKCASCASVAQYSVHSTQCSCSCMSSNMNIITFLSQSPDPGKQNQIGVA